jgi:hypothetical protein
MALSAYELWQLMMFFFGLVSAWAVIKGFDG